MANKKKTSRKPKRELTRRQLSQAQRQKRRQRIIYISGISIIAAAILIVLVSWIALEIVPLHSTVLKVGDRKFDLEYYVDALKMSQTSDWDNVATLVAHQELVRLAAEGLGITVSDEQVKKELESIGSVVSDIAIDVRRTDMLLRMVKDQVFAPQVPESDLQVNTMIMFVESQEVASEVRQRLLNGDNFTELAGEFAWNSFSQNVNQGDFGWHPRDVLSQQLESEIPLDYAFSAEAGSLSEPLQDDETYKKIGYWLINVVDRPSDNESEVKAVLLTSEAFAEEIKARLEAGEELGPIADEYTQYSTLARGELGVLSSSENISNAFNGYVFNLETELNVWSYPIRDETFYTQGGAWLVKLVDRQEDRPLSAVDRDALINKLVQDWYTSVVADPDKLADYSYLTDERKQDAWLRALE